MEDIIIGIIVLLIVSVALFFIVKQKKKGVKCIGCSNGTVCSGSCNSCKKE